MLLKINDLMQHLWSCKLSHKIWWQIRAKHYDT